MNNGRLYFPSTDICFFPADALADRKGDGHKGNPVVFHANGEPFETDVRISSGQRISPRASFSRYLKSVRADAGDKLKVTRTSDREYEIEHQGK
ncbi:MAG: hypothetical protein JSS17_10200 [Proteobacteria bacterium]|nr:hypothetical protein [Pseudomonadota bacterium]